MMSNILRAKKDCVHSKIQASVGKRLEISSLDKTSKDPLNFVKPANTRWLSILEAVHRIKAQWQSLKLYFVSIECETGSDTYSARTLRGMYNDDKNYLLIAFLEQHLEPAVKLNKDFQAESANYLALPQNLEEIYISFLSYVVTSEGLHLAKCNKDLYNFDYTPYSKESTTVVFFLDKSFICLSTLLDSI